MGPQEVKLSEDLNNNNNETFNYPTPHLFYKHIVTPKDLSP